MFRTINDFINLSNGDQLRFAPTACECFKIIDYFLVALMI